MTVGTLRASRLALLVLLGALLYLPSFTTPQLHGEEGRRAIPAREMLRSGDFVLPTIWGQPYLNKPPLYFWLVAGASRLRGGVDEFATRLPSVLATIATGALTAVFGAALFGEAAGLAAGLLFLLGLNVLGKGALGEIEPPFALAVVASIALLQRGGRVAVAASGAALAAALLLKGPAALLFYLAAAVGLAASGGGARLLRSARVLVPLAIGVGAALVWVAALLREPGTGDALSTWLGEATRSGGRSVPSAYLGDRFAFAGAALAATLPSSALLALAAATRSGRGLLREPPARFLLVTLAVSFGYFLLAPGARPRYVYPVTPLACILAGAFLARSLADASDRRAAAGLRGLAALVLAGGVVAVALVLAAPLHPIRGVDPLVPAGVGLALALAAVCGSGLLRLRRGSLTGLAWHAAAGIAVLRLFQLTVVVPQLEGARLQAARVRALEPAIPGRGPVLLHVRALWNELAYLERPARWIDAPGSAAPGDVLLLDEFALPRFRSELALEEIERATIRAPRELAVVRVLGPAGSP